MMSFDTSSTTINIAQHEKTCLEIVSDPDNLYEAFTQARRSSWWKTTTQKCSYDILRRLSRLHRELLNNTYKQKPFFEFILSERGKIRPIRSQCIIDRTLQRSLCDNVLIPTLRPYLIYDNGASLKSKGVDFSKNRIKVHLEKFLRHHDNGYILLIDFSKFFDNIPHKQLLEQISKRLKDNTLMPLLVQILKSFCPDVSYLSDEEFESERKPFDSVEHRGLRRDYTGEKGKKVFNKSMGIGSQISQISGVYYPSRIDNYFKCVLGLKYYGRYMDDVYIIHEDKEYLKNILNDFVEKAKEIHLYVNIKKTQITNIKNGFTYLKMTYKVVGKKIVVRPNKKTFVRERRRLRKFKNMLNENKITRKIISDSYQSWKGSVKKYSCFRRNLSYTDRLYRELFVYD